MPIKLTPVEDWRDLPAGLALDAVVAAKVGYSDFSISPTSNLLWGYRAATPEDHPWSLSDDGEGHDGQVYEAVSHYSDDLSAAVFLPLDGENHSMETIIYRDGSFRVQFVALGVCIGRGGDNLHEIAAVYCKVWLQMREEMHD